MNSSELKTKICASKKFLSRYVYSDIHTIGDENGELELCDCLIEFSKAYIVIQIKEKDSIKSNSSFNEWFHKKVIKKATRQIKDSKRQLNNPNYSFKSNNKEVIIDKKRDFRYVILFDSDDVDDEYEKYYISETGVEMNIFSFNDFENMLDNLIIPHDIFEFLDFRKQFYVENRYNKPLIIDNISTEMTLVGRVNFDIQVSDYFLLKCYKANGLNVDDIFKFNHIVNELDKNNQFNSSIMLKTMMSFNRNEVILFIKNWNDALNSFNEKDFVLPSIMCSDTEAFICFGVPKVCKNKELINYKIECLIYDCFEQFNSSIVYLFLFEFCEDERYSVSVDEYYRKEFAETRDVNNI